MNNTPAVLDGRRHFFYSSEGAAILPFQVEERGITMRHSDAMAVLGSGATVDVSSFNASPGGTGGSPSAKVRRPGTGTERQPRPENG